MRSGSTATQRSASDARLTAWNPRRRSDSTFGRARAIKALLEEEVGPEEGPDSVHMQNWDWNDDRCRSVMVLRRAFDSALIPNLQALLVGEFADFQLIVSLTEDWSSKAWGHLKLDASQVAVQRNVAQMYGY